MVSPPRQCMRAPPEGPRTRTTASAAAAPTTAGRARSSVPTPTQMLTSWSWIWRRLRMRRRSLVFAATARRRAAPTRPPSPIRSTPASARRSLMAWSTAM
eukprot:Amastigsp_a342865_12.p4 type:complete len:100 gc:universal Amastigsp_a342865_12:956-657(-)